MSLERREALIVKKERLLCEHEERASRLDAEREAVISRREAAVRDQAHRARGQKG